MHRLSAGNLADRKRLVRGWRGWAHRAGLALLLLVASLTAAQAAAAQAADQVSPEDEYRDLIRAPEGGMSPLGAHPFGERVDRFQGTLSFVQTDLAWPGTGPSIAITREYTIVGARRSGENRDGLFADWELALPRITTFVTEASLAHTWQVATTGDPYDRCSAFAAPPTVDGINNAPAWEPEVWWNGYQLIIPGVGSQDLLKRDLLNDWEPGASIEGIADFPIVTRNKWVLGCLSSVDNASGEGFLAVSPDGTRYWFDHMAVREAANLQRSWSEAPRAGQKPQLPPENILQRHRATLFVTRIEDRFGNGLTFSYDPNKPSHLTAIHAGREGTTERTVAIKYDNPSYPDYISAISRTGTVDGVAITHTWTYSYAAAPGSTALTVLSSVTRPDGSQWSFDLASLMTDARLDLDQDAADSPADACNRIRALYPDTWSGSITTPSGLTGTFTIRGDTRGRTAVTKLCAPGPDGGIGTSDDYALRPYVSYVFALTQKTAEGPGLPGNGWTWTWTYSDPHPSWGSNPPWDPTDSCSGDACYQSWSEVTDPNGNAVRYTFSTRADATEGLLLEENVCDGSCAGTSPVVLRTTTRGYALPSAGPWPADLGDDLQLRVNHAKTSQLTPRNLRTIAENGDTYTWQATAFNDFGQVTATTRKNDIAGGEPDLIETRSWFNDTAHWVLGQPLQKTVAGIAATKYHYAPDGMPQDRWSFGRKVMSYSFYPNGELEAFTDARNHTTTLGNYKLGIPREVTYADLTGSSVEVDDFGQIPSATDEEGDKTEYTYDALGRLTGITHPDHDPVAWNPESITYEKVSSPEYGVAAGHWRVTRQNGSHRQITIYDAALNPVLTKETGIGTGKGSMVWRQFDAGGRETFRSWPLAYGSTLPTACQQVATCQGVGTDYDALGRVIGRIVDSELGPLSTTTAYLAGNRTKVIDPEGHATVTTWQAFDKPRREQAVQVVFADGTPLETTTTITRDVWGKPLTMTQSGTWNPPGPVSQQTLSVSHQFTYDSYQQLCLQTSPETGQTAWGYYANGLLQWSAEGLSGHSTSACPAAGTILATDKTVHTYGARDRLLTVDYPGTSADKHFSYHDDGTPETASRDADGSHPVSSPICRTPHK